MPDINFTAYSFRASSATGASSRTMPTRLNDICNVKEFGAIGDGVTNDTTAVQTTIDTAFGGPTGRTADNGWHSKMVFFPPGKYKVLGPIIIPPGAGMRIMGSGSHATIIDNQQAGVDAIQTGGFGYSRMESFKIKTLNGNCLKFNDDNGAHVRDQSSSFINMAYEGGDRGVGVGPTMGSEMLFVNNTFTNHFFGMDTHNFNCLQWTLLGGRFINCQYGIYCGGSAPAIIGCQFENSGVSDFFSDSGANDSYLILGTRSNSSIGFDFTSAVAFSVAACSHTTASNSIFIRTANLPLSIKGCISDLGNITVSINPVVKIVGSRFARSDWLDTNPANFYGFVEQENLLVGTSTVIQRKRHTVTAGPALITYNYDVS